VREASSSLELLHLLLHGHHRHEAQCEKLALDQQVRPPPLPCLAPSRSPAHHSAVLPTCSGDADLEQRGHQGCGPRRRRVRRAVRPRVRRAWRQQVPKGGRRGGWVVFFFFLSVHSDSHRYSRGRHGGGGGSGRSAVSTRALIAARSATSGGGAGGGAPCALRLVLIPPGAPMSSQAPRAAWACARQAPRALEGVVYGPVRWVSCALWVVCGRIWASLGPLTALQPLTVIIYISNTLYFKFIISKFYYFFFFFC